MKIKNIVMKNKKRWITAISIILLILAIAVIYPKWNEIWYDFGRNLYHLVNG